MSLTSTTVVAPDFADVYAAHLADVWRFVRSRVPDHHESYDVTSEVFVRAWRSWDRFDPRRGPVEPWLFTIAQRTITDWWRRRRDLPVDAEPAGSVDARTPETEALTTELLEQLGSALDRLGPRERDALALRFAARLSMEHVALVLGTTTGAAKMIIHRSIRRLRDEQVGTGTATGSAADLEAVIDDVVAGGRSPLTEHELSELLLAMATLHDPAVPPDLSGHVVTCVQCAAEDDVDGGRGSDDPPGDGAGTGATVASRRDGRGRVANGVAAITAFMGICLVCTVPALQTLAWALGVGVAGYAMHLAGVAGAPLVAWMILRGTRRHGRGRAFELARAGAVVMGVHAVLHLRFEVLADVAVAGWVDAAVAVAFVATDWLATALLVAGAILNLVESQRWRRAQAQGLRSPALASA